MGRGEGGVGGRERAEAGRRGETLWRLRRAPPPTPQPDPHAPALHAVAHISLEARVGPRLEQRLDAGSAAVENRAVQRSVLVLPKRGGGPTQVGERRWRVGGCLWRVQAPFAPLPACMRAGRPRAGSRRTLFWAFRLAPLAMRCSRQPSLPFKAAYMSAVLPHCATRGERRR